MIKMREAEKYKPLTIEEEREAFIAYKKNGDEEAVKKLIFSNVKFIMKMARKYSANSGLSIDDLFMAGYQGFHNGLDAFDINREGNARLMSVVRHYVGNAMKDEVAKMLGAVSVSRNVKKKGTVSLNTRLENDEGEGHEKIDFVEDENDNMKAAEEAEVRDFIFDKINELPNIERKVMLGKAEGKTLEEIGQRLNLTKERVRQIYEKALVHIRIEVKKEFY